MNSTQIPYRLHHIGLLCADTTASGRFYTDVLGFEQIGRFHSPNAFDLTFLASGSDLLLELVGEPLSNGERAFVAQRGHALHHIALQTPNVDAAFADLTARGLRVGWEPDTFEFVRHCAVLDNSGNLIEILQELDPLPPVTKLGNVPFQLHHPCLLTESWQETLAFYAEHFGFVCPFQYVYSHGGAFVYLADPFFNTTSHYAMIELIGKPYEEAREFAFAEKFGTGIDHIGLIVPDVAQAYAQTQSASGATLPPYANYGTELCWIQDPDGNDIELMLPLPTDKLMAAFKSDQPYLPNQN